MQYFLTLNKPIPLTPLLREYFNPLIIWPLVLIPAFRLSVWRPEFGIVHAASWTGDICTHTHIYTPQMKTAGWIALEVQARGPGWQRAGQPLPGFSPISPLASCPSRIPWAGNGADVRATRGHHLSAAQSRQQRSASPRCYPRGPGVLDGPGPHPRPRPSEGRPILRPLSLLGRKPTFSSFPLPLHFLPSHLPPSLALLFLFAHFSPLRQPHPHLKKSPASKVFPFYGLESNVLEVLGAG